MNDEIVPPGTEHTVAWFYLCDELEKAKQEATRAREAARVYWGSVRCQEEAFVAELRVAQLQKAVQNA